MCLQSYAAPLLDILDPERRIFAHRLYRDSCLRAPSCSQPGLAFLMKDLASLGRDLSTTFIVDNTPTVRSRHLHVPARYSFHVHHGGFAGLFWQSLTPRMGPGCCGRSAGCPLDYSDEGLPHG